MIAAEAVRGATEDDRWHQQYALVRNLTAVVLRLETSVDRMQATLTALTTRVEELTEEIRWEDDEDDDDDEDISWVASDHTSESGTGEEESDLITEDDTSESSGHSALVVD
jgi:uncharacterized coiled-coil protein SlyX